MSRSMRRAGGAALVVALLCLAPAGAESPVPEVARAFLEKAETAREEGRLEEATGLYKQAISEHPTYWKAHSGFLACLRGTGDMGPAAALYSRLMAEIPDSVDLKAFAAAAKDPEDAVAELTQLQASFAGAPRVLVELCRAQLRAGRYREAEKSARAAIKIDPDSAVAPMLLGDVYLKTNKAAKARKAYQALVDRDRSSVPAQLRLALAWHQQRRSTEALKLLAHLLSEENLPRLVAGYWVLARIRADLGKYEEAVQALDKVLAIDTGDLDARMAKGRVLLRANRPMEAAKVFSELTEGRKSLSEAWFALGWCYERGADAPEIQGEPAKVRDRLVAAANAYTKSAEIDPTVRPRDSLGFVYLLGDEQGEALTQFKRAADIEPKFAPTQNNLGLAMDIAGDRKSAKKRYSHVLKKIDRNNVRARVMLALSYWLDGAHSKAIKELEKVIKEAPEDDLARTFLGDIQYDKKKLGSAIRRYKEAVKLNDKNFNAWYHMGIAYEEKKKDEEADRCYRKALEAKPEPPPELLLRLAEINDEELLDNLKDALQFYQLYRDVGGKETWVPNRISEIQAELAKTKKKRK